MILPFQFLTGGLFCLSLSPFFLIELLFLIFGMTHGWHLFSLASDQLAGREQYGSDVQDGYTKKPWSSKSSLDRKGFIFYALFD
jgi:hypothetical protein